MSEGQSPTATLTGSREPTPQDVELLHSIVLRAQQEPLADPRDTLMTAYESVLKERGLDLNQDDVCFWVLLELLKPGLEGVTLYEKFESVMRNKNIEVVFDDEASTHGQLDEPYPQPWHLPSSCSLHCSGWMICACALWS